MKVVGIALLIGGAALIALAFQMNVAVDGGDGSKVANNDLLNQRLLFAIVGSGVFVSGWIALLLDRLPRRSTPKT